MQELYTKEFPVPLIAKDSSDSEQRLYEKFFATTRGPLMKEFYPNNKASLEQLIAIAQEKLSKVMQLDLRYIQVFLKNAIPKMELALMWAENSSSLDSLEDYTSELHSGNAFRYLLLLEEQRPTSFSRHAEDNLTSFDPLVCSNILRFLIKRKRQRSDYLLIPNNHHFNDLNGCRDLLVPGNYWN